MKWFVELLENIPLAPLTTIRIGGPARYFIEAKDVGEVQEAVAFSRSRDLPLFVLGGGSNLVVADSGWPGLILKIAIPASTNRRDSTRKAMLFLWRALASHGTSWFPER
jgi:UDP-N-acetylmuramate dehydrogenase